MPPQGYAGSMPYEDAHSPLMDTSVARGPEVVASTPPKGPEGSHVQVRVVSPFDLHSNARASFLSFGSRQSECTVSLLGYNNSTFSYVFSGPAPVFAATMSPSFDVLLQLVIDLASSNGPLVLRVGVFTYQQPLQAAPEGSRKRRVSLLTGNAALRLVKRHSAQEIEIKAEYPIERSASYSPFLQPSTTANAYPAQYKPETSPRAAYEFFTTTSGSQASLQATSPMTPSWSPSLSVSHAVSHSSVSAPNARPPNPSLIRTSTIQQPSNLNQAQPFNPYAMYPSKAVLKLNGNLDSMVSDWNAEEKSTKRRLVQFTRTQSGSTIHADFKPVSLEERAPNSICISCIFWDGKDECFVTSVDTIYLLESLVGVRFTVEEKNRIRRNLEGFRPLTVSKTKADSEEFFRTVMGFPAPKPRNIEKDVKVFPWKILSHALKKIIGKYVSLEDVVT
jgi:hypothetical protein